MTVTIKKTKEAYELLKEYEGNNPYLSLLKKLVYVKKDKTLSDLDIDYIILNYKHEPEVVNKVVKIAKWFGEKQIDKWNVSFVPEKVQILSILGETESVIHVLLKYKRNQEKPCMCFIPKKALLDDLRAEDFNNFKIDFSKYNDILSKFGKKLYGHQESAVKFLLSRKKCLLADSMGLGKSTSAVVASIEGNFKKILIICPASLKSTWKREISTFIPENEIGIINSNNWIHDKKYTIINYDILESHYKVAKESFIKERPLYRKDGSPKLDENGNQLIERKEKFFKSRKKDAINKALSESNIYNEGFDLVIIDECHKLSNSTSIRYEIISDYLKKSKMENVFLISGTPMTNKPINLFHVLSLINHPVCDNFEYFVKTYCDGKKIKSKTTHKDIWLTGGASNLDELMEKVKNVYIRRLKSDVPGMVQKTIHQRFYELTDDERFVYEQLWNEYEESQIQLGNDNLNKELTEGILLRQFISNAMIKNTEQLADEFLEDDNKVFIACCFNEEISHLKEYFGDKAVIYKGGMSIKQKDESEYKFMNDPKTTVFIGNIIAAGVGLTLTSAHICIFNSYSWVPGDNSQISDRIYRIGQKEDVEIFYQLFSNTISDHMWDTVVRKDLNIDKVIKEENNKN
jgi:SWI/SNF-related matrix-associated actin-dependent regulator 1 of chromatin subfamily A